MFAGWSKQDCKIVSGFFYQCFDAWNFNKFNNLFIKSTKKILTTTHFSQSRFYSFFRLTLFAIFEGTKPLTGIFLDSLVESFIQKMDKFWLVVIPSSSSAISLRSATNFEHHFLIVCFVLLSETRIINCTINNFTKIETIICLDYKNKNIFLCIKFWLTHAVLQQKMFFLNVPFKCSRR